MNAKWVVGVDLGGTTTKIAFITTDGQIIEKWEIPTDNSDKGVRITENIVTAIHDKLAELGVGKEKLLGIGMGSPGPVNYEKGIVINTVNLGWENQYPLKSVLEDAFGLPAYIDNDANCAALGEMWKGAGNGSKDLVCITLGTGVGGGVIVNGRSVQGVNGAAGEVGHTTLIPVDGAPCNCGKSGCLETIASATGIVRLAHEKLADEKDEQSKLKMHLEEKGHIEAKDVFHYAELGDRLSLEVIEEMAYYLGLALANLGSTLNPEVIIIGGGVSKAGQFLLNHIQPHFDHFSFTSVRESTKLALATLGNDAGVLGAGWLVKNEQCNQ